jgi:hypothetical protein
MKRTLVLTLGLLTATAVSVEAQLAFFPVDALPSGSAATFFGATYGRGMNDASLKLDAYSAFIGRSGIGNRATLAAGVGMIDFPAEGEWTYGAALGIDVLPAGGSAQLSVQTGLGYFSPVTDASTMHIPVGLALKGMIEGPTADVAPWVMPRVSILRASVGDVSDTSTDFGVSGGVMVTLPNGFGVHTSVDVLAADATQWLLGVGVHYSMP